MLNLKEGYLWKFSPGIIKCWKQRYFVLTNNGVLNIYDRQGGRFLKSVNVSNKTTELKVGHSILHKIPSLPKNYHSVNCVFMLRNSIKMYLFLTESATEFNSWMQAIKQFRGQQKPQPSPQPLVSPFSAPSNPAPLYPEFANPTAPTCENYQPQSATNPHNIGFENLSLGNPYPPVLPTAAGYQGTAHPTPYPNQPASYTQQHHYPSQQPGYAPRKPAKQHYPQQYQHAQTVNNAAGAVKGTVVGRNKNKTLTNLATIVAGGYALKQASKLFGGPWSGSDCSDCSWGS